jgi:cellulose 1,4-beta-cellobiosidase
MKKEHMIFFALLFLPIGLTAQQIIELPNPGSTSVMGGEYNVANNVWGSGTGVGLQTLAVDLSGTYWKVILSTHNSSSVAAYPFIWKGSHWGGTATKNSPMPKMISEIGSAPFTWVIDTTGAIGTWNCAYESWFNETGTGANYTAELMIWINYHGGAGPGGGKIATVNIGGHTWDVYYALWNWNYIAYKLTSPTDSVSLDFKDFILDALNRGYLCTPWYLANMEAGFEIWSNGQGLTTKSFSASVIDGPWYQNYAPTSFILNSPPINKKLTSMIIPFTWQKSIDANLDPIEYIFHLSGPNFDTTITQIEDDSLLFDGSQCLQSYTPYTWYIEATDGIDTTESTTRRTFTTPRITGVYSIDQVPCLFSLDQNYPNPFNPQTTISYSLSKTSTVTLIVYDLIGREIKMLVDNERKAAGAHKVTFDATNLPSGAYFYKLQSETFMDIKEMVLIK